MTKYKDELTLEEMAKLVEKVDKWDYKYYLVDRKIIEGKIGDSFSITICPISKMDLFLTEGPICILSKYRGKHIGEIEVEDNHYNTLGYNRSEKAYALYEEVRGKLEESLEQERVKKRSQKNDSICKAREIIKGESRK